MIKWIQKLKKGGLHRSLGIAMDKTIPLSILKKATKAKGKVGRQARTAMTLKRLRKRAFAD